MTAPDIIENSDLYDYLYLGGVRSPGVVKLSGHNRKVTWDVKSGHSLSGAQVTLKEVPPIEFTATFYLVNDPAMALNDFDDWYTFLAVVESSVNGTKPKALDIYHPDLASQTPPISSVVKAEVGGVVHDGKGGQTVAIKFQEYRPPKPKGGTAAKGKDPDAAALAELAALTKQYQATPWG